MQLRHLLFENSAPFLLLLLHSDEKTGAEAAEAFARRKAIPFLQVLNNKQRLIMFTLNDEPFRFDPNRIFSDEGIRKTLALSSRYTDTALTEVRRLRDTLLAMVDTTLPIVAVHNNTEGRFNLLQYRDVGGAELHVNETQDTDDFFITNDAAFFTSLKKANFNVVLENVAEMEDDGTLSLYCGRQNIRYINVEAQHGHGQQQVEMLQAVFMILTERKK